MGAVFSEPAGTARTELSSSRLGEFIEIGGE